ncbi:MAG TPA: hypothetical protein VKT99_12445 [Xanthobacteraceae bacterium]|jgi:hypothetical protein|nr:hypothetical protein [Xanthobacteraceae bacterium]
MAVMKILAPSRFAITTGGVAGHVAGKKAVLAHSSLTSCSISAKKSWKAASLKKADFVASKTGMRFGLIPLELAS